MDADGPEPATVYPCACCGYLTRELPPGAGDYDICPVCYWEDCTIQFRDQTFAGGPNDASLAEARRNFEAFGVIEGTAREHVRHPAERECPRYDWNVDPNGYGSS